LPFKSQGLDVNAIEVKNDAGQNNVRFWTQELRASSSALSELPLKWTLGGFYFTQYDPTSQTLLIGKDGSKFGQPNNAKSSTSALADNSGIAFFGQATYAINEALSLTAGLRYDSENQKLTVGSKFQQGTYTATTLKDTTANTSFSAFSPKANLTYKVAENQIAYVSYNRGYRAGGFSQIDFDPSGVPLVAFAPEYSNNLEFGWKGTYFDNRLRANLAVFNIQVTDAQIPTLVPELGFRTAIRNGGNFSSTGFESEISANIAKGLQIDWNFGITSATYSKLALPQTVYVAGKPTKVTTDFTGNKQIFTPSFTSMLAIQYSAPLSKTIHYLARGEWRLLGKQYFDLPNKYSQDDYSLINVRTGFSTKNYDLMFWGRNLANTTYISYAYNFGAATLGNPRTVGVSMMAKF
jgi:iron complex outermembrane receptor protein